MAQSVKKHAGHAFSQFRLTNDLLQNLYKHEITPTAKLVLLYLSSCYNPKKADMFPKQKTIAAKLGVSEASVIRGVSELHKEGLIISERKYTNRYKFTSKIVSEQPQDEKNFASDILQCEISQNESKETCKMQPACNNLQKEHIKQPLKVEDYKILKEYALKYGAKKVQAYVNKLIRKGSAEGIIKDYKQMQANAQGMIAKAKQVQKDLEFARANRSKEIPQSFYEMKEILKERAKK